MAPGNVVRKAPPFPVEIEGAAAVGPHNPRRIDVHEVCEGRLADLLRPSGQESLAVQTAPRDFAEQGRRADHLFTIPERLIREARETHDLVVIDSAAVFPTNRMMMDPVLLSGVVDGVVMVVLTARTPRQQARRAQTIMEAAGARILGAVSNQWSPPAAR